MSTATAFIADRRLYLTVDGRVVEEGDPEAHMLLVGRGGRVSFQTARKYGLEAKAVPEAPQNKAIQRTRTRG